jgi:enamine deaminase RidA (YjgF/YER057c/UK114 family)
MSDPISTAILPEGWQRAQGYSYGMVSTGGQTVRIAGQVAQIRGGAVEAGLDIGAQFALALGNVVEVLAAAGGKAEHLVNLRAYVTDMDAFNAAGKAVGAAWGEHLGRHFPAMTLLEVTKLFDANAAVEIEAEAVIP